MLVNCLVCKKEIKRKPSDICPSGKIFCSHSCSASFNNIGIARNPAKIRICKKCNNNYKGQSRYCSDCSKKSVEYYKSFTIKEYQEKLSMQGKHRSWRNAQIRDFNRSWNKNLKKIPCQVCGYSKHIEFAHIKAISSFPEDSTLGEVNDPTNILILCPNHHWELDNGKLPFENIPDRI